MKRITAATLTAVTALMGTGLTGAGAWAGGAAPAPVEPLVMPLPPAPVATRDWSGGYAGLSLGYGAVDSEGSDVLEDLDGDGNDDLFDVDIDGDGAIGGAFAGYQYDFGRFVLGGEVDLNAADLDFDEDDFNTDGDDDGGATIDAVHRLKLRAGYDAGPALIYGIAGVAYAEADIGYLSGAEFSDTGYLLGAGVDYAVTPTVTVGAEVIQHSFDDFDDTGIDFDATTFQARVAYSF